MNIIEENKKLLKLNKPKESKESKESEELENNKLLISNYRVLVELLEEKVSKQINIIKKVRKKNKKL